MAFLIDDLLIAAAIASAVASAGGTAASMMSQSAIRSKQKAAQNAETARQAEIDRRRNAAVTTAVPEYNLENQEKKQQSMAEQIAQYVAPQENTSTQYLAANPGAPKEVTDSMSRQLVGALEKGRNYAKDLSQVSSYGRLGFNNKLNLNRLGENMTRLNSESARSSGILPMELEGAYGAGVGAQNAASIFNGIGGLANAAAAYSIMSPKLPGATQLGGTTLNQPQYLAAKTLPKITATPLKLNG
jgi:type II secretory pathway pseudopilin PulG